MTTTIILGTRDYPRLVGITGTPDKIVCPKAGEPRPWCDTYCTTRCNNTCPVDVVRE